MKIALLQRIPWVLLADLAALDRLRKLPLTRHEHEKALFNLWIIGATHAYPKQDASVF